VGTGVWAAAAVAGLGALIITSWDLGMDPMMVKAGHWVWEVKGAYFGVPLQNYWGWWLTSFTAFGIFLLCLPVKMRPFSGYTIRGRPVSPAAFDRLVVVSYLLTGLGDGISALMMGLAGPGLIGMAAMAVWIALAWRRMHPDRPIQA